MKDFYNINEEYNKFFSAETFKEQIEALDSLSKKIQMMIDDMKKDYVALEKIYKELKEKRIKEEKKKFETGECVLSKKEYNSIIKQLVPGADVKYFNNTKLFSKENLFKRISYN